MQWYRVVQFECPGCGQTLGVEAAQARRQERVTCQDCNTDILLVERGQEASTSPSEASLVVVTLNVR